MEVVFLNLIFLISSFAALWSEMVFSNIFILLELLILALWSVFMIVPCASEKRCTFCFHCFIHVLTHTAIRLIWLMMSFISLVPLIFLIKKMINFCPFDCVTRTVVSSLLSFMCFYCSLLSSHTVSALGHCNVLWCRNIHNYYTFTENYGFLHLKRSILFQFILFDW